MDLDYDHKFEEMKKYIPFLDNMIRRLESTGSGSSNPRQAQLDKIRSLRDLLQDKKKRMKMENLLKCEQVLINLYTKVEQRDHLPDKSKGTDSQPRKSSDLETVRNKLKCVTMINAADADTLPEIARSSEMAEMCTPGSKEPALFQRRPNSVSQVTTDSSPNKTTDSSIMSSSQSNSRRGYTRVLLSPETSSRRWDSNESTSSNKLFSRRSPKRISPSYSKKERKKTSTNINQLTKNNDLNITLNVPEDSLNSLNTKDILSRIITCSNDDVDIKTLRELRTQILGELKQTGANDDISDLILKSYKTKKSGVKEEIEEGELSDSESEAIESIYGSLVVVDQDKSNILLKNNAEKDQSRKIQICLVINSKDDKLPEQTIKEPQKMVDTSDFDLSNENDRIIKDIDEREFKNEESVSMNISYETQSVIHNKEIRDQIFEEDNNSSFSHNNKKTFLTTSVKSNKIEESEKEIKDINIDIKQNINDNKTNVVKITKEEENNSSYQLNKCHQGINQDRTETVAFKANFYKPLVNDEVGHKDVIVTNEKLNERQECSSQSNKTTGAQVSLTATKNKEDSSNTLGEPKQKDLELPFLNEPCITNIPIEKDVVSQIDILQALKNEILNENIDIHAGSVTCTPPLHQPKLVKVASAQKIIPNRISIEKYKEKAASLSPLFKNNRRFSKSTKEDSVKKQSIKLTEKECERFNFTSNIGLNDVNISSEDEVDKGSDTLDNVYDDLAPKSPDLDDSNDILKAPPIIIPAEPVKAIVVSSKSDVDMRTFVPNVSTDATSSNINVNSPQEKIQECLINEAMPEKKEGCYTEKSKLFDPRIRRDIVQPTTIESTNTDRIPRSTAYSNVISTGIRTGNMTPNTTASMTPSLTPNIPPLMGSIMTPNSRTYENTPSRQSFDVEGSISNSKHVYAPSFPLFEYHKTNENSVSKESNSQWDSETNVGKRKSRWEDTSCNEPYKNDNNKGQVIERFKVDGREDISRMDCPRTPIPSFGWTDSSNSANVFNILDSPMTPSNCFGRIDCPSTPSHPFGRLDCPPTPSNLFGQSECPPTPVYPFGQPECPPTPVYPFGQSECPSTPIYPFVRADCPPTPSHPFGHLDGSTTPSHPFGRLEGSSTPNHPFGRFEGSATPSHTFGRTDFSQNNINRQIYKDPRLNKNSDFDQGSQSIDNDRRYYRDRGFKRGNSYKSHKRGYSNSQSYGKYDREQSIGRNDYNTYYSNEHSGSRFYRESRREPSIAHSTKDRESDRRYNERDGRYNYDNRSSYRDRGTKYYQEKSVGHISSTEENYQSTARRQNVSINAKNETNVDNNLSVKSHAGRSFVIDTSVNSTFQDLIQKKGIDIFNYTFDTHRKRASSVGRSLIRESTVSRTLSHDSKSEITNDELPDNNKNSRFTRARSLGRDIDSVSNEKSFQDIKADFKRYKSQIDSKLFNNEDNGTKGKDNKNSLKHSRAHNKSDSGARSRKHIYEKYKDGRNSESTLKLQYSPHKNFRDPRMRGEIDRKSKYQNIDKSRCDEKSSGIVYSNDNIAKGAILGSGFGVKNYKIPKIKRVTSEIEENELRLDEKIENTKTKENTNVDIEKTNTQSSVIIESDNTDENSTRRITRSSSKIIPLKLVDDDIFVKTRKTKKPLVYESESESESLVNEKEYEDSNTSSQEALEIDKNTPKKLELNSVFNVEDLDVFSDNIVSDPVAENINALIADLDNDIDTSKNELTGGFAKVDTFDSMMFIMDSSDKLEHLRKKSIPDINEAINEELHEENENKNEVNENKMIDAVQKDENLNANTHETASVSQKDVDKLSNESLNNTHDIICENKTSDPKVTGNTEDMSNLVLNSINSEPIVSTTYTDSECSKLDEEKNILTCTDEDNNDGCSTPDSTINMNEDVLMKSECGGVPDSTNEQKSDVKTDATNELNTDVTSTNTSGDLHSTENIKPCSSRQLTPAIDSIGSLLSMLQDKSKIKELVSMLGEKSGENEKIKKKLEKLSEIVSDDEDTNDGMETKIDNTVEIAIKDNITPNVIYPDKKIIKESQTNDESMDTIDMSTTDINNEGNETLEESTVETNLDDKTAANCIDSSLIINVSKESNADNTLNDILKDKNEEKPKDLEEDIETCTDSVNLNTVEEEYHDKTLNTDIEIIGTEKIPEKVTPKIKKTIKKSRRKFTKTNKVNRITRTSTPNLATVKNTSKKKPCRELLQLQEDIKEMFLNGELLQTSGIRMCRLVKLVDEKNIQKEDVPVQDPKQVVVLKKCKEINKRDNTTIEKPTRKKPGPKPKSKAMGNDVNIEQENKNKVQTTLKNKSTSKNKAKITQKHADSDPYAFESDSVDTHSLNESRDEDEYSSDSENTSLNSSRSFGSNELLTDLTKNLKRKRRNNSWQAGIIKSKNKKKKQADLPKDNELSISQADIVIPDMECFTDQLYCFEKNVSIYSCRLCVYTGNEIVHHYKQQHPHVEIPLSRMNPTTAKEAIAQCKNIDFRVIGRVPTDRYVCRFCCKEFGKGKNVMESFFWHVVSMHTGEYKHNCSECENASNCSFNLDIPPPPTDMKGQLIGYICKKCNFTQISIENLKRHVIVRHNDEKTEVYKINLAVMTKKLLKYMTNLEALEPPRVTRSSSINRHVDDIENDQSYDSDHSNNETSSMQAESPERQSPDKLQIKSKIIFEIDDHGRSPSNLFSKFKQENENDYSETEDNLSNFENDADTDLIETQNPLEKAEFTQISTESNDIIACPHFKINYQSSGTKEYVCCINGQDNHYKTSLLISMKKHIQTKHTELWEGYCVLCKVIVTSQGNHSFKHCLQHMLDKHMDEFPLLDNSTEIIDSQILPDIEDALPKSYINVRPLAQLVTKSGEPVSQDTVMSYPKIDTVVSLGNVEPSRSNPNYPTTKKAAQPEKQYVYEEWQAEVMSKKHRVVLETMMTRDKLVQVYKCAGRFCSFTSDSAEGALLHASTHQRIGGKNALICPYCDFDTSGNAIDLVMHVFKVHGRCQYSCALCFYRAAARQLVGAHVERIHKEKPGLGSVLRTKTLSMPVTEDSANLLSREDAVEYYHCAHGLGGSNPNARCLQKSYLPDKFVEHLENKHVAPHPCTMCTYKASTPIDLIEHMKSHNMNAYQCTWCVHGADNELELMTHASIYHPTKHPNAYVRIMTTKENLSELRILPMASFNKINTPVEDVTSNVTDDPMREAERSLDLEKLIGDIGVVTTSDLSKSDTLTKITEDVAEDSLVVEPKQIQLETENHTKTSSTLPDLVKKVNEQAGLVKTEPDEQKSTLDSADVIYCSDSDEGESRPAVIDLSNDDTVIDSPVLPVETRIRVSSDSLHKCPKCSSLCRTMVGFKKHMVACFGHPSLKSYKCAHFPCRKMLHNINDIVQHYIKDHKEENGPSFFCGICNGNFTSLRKAKQHVKYAHRIDNQIILATFDLNGKTVHTVQKGNEQPLRKRKSSSETPKQRRYGPHDVDKLPITPILEDLVYCSLCEFNTKVRLNMVRHLQLHAEQQPVPHTAPVNPVPHLETNEKHFDKMLNLASSSFATRGLDKARSDTSTSVSLVPPETANRYPKFVPERQRYTCGSKGCAYISLSEDMFRCHWETLHSNTNEYHCVHCPPNQQLDTRKPLTASLIIGHLKMHDTMLYACPLCSYYHYKRQLVDCHIISLHGKGQIVVVREDSSTAGAIPAPSLSAPTMDLKPWQCGVCKFKSMLRPEVTEHCSKVHQSKMQYKCTYCPFRTSTLENVTKHQTNSHPDKNQDVFYYYYREGSVPDDEDGTPLWMKQKQKTNPSEPEVKTEVPDSSIQTPSVSIAPVTAAISVDLNKVKQEMDDADMDSEVELSLTDLCKKYGQFCDPNGILYKCSLCKVIVEDNKQAMQSHLYEELKYRRFCCGICSYKAFHLSGLNEHMASEHKREFQEPVKLPTNVNIEKWVAKHLEHQAGLIKLNEERISKQILTVSKVTAGPSRNADRETVPEPPRMSLDELEKAFGEVGVPSDMQFCCPKCSFSDKDENSMRQHLENELAKIRWGCNLCSNYYQTYHQAQFHCKSIHSGQSARPTEAIRDANVRAAWVAAVIQSQKLLIDIPTNKTVDDEHNFLDNSDNSLLVVRYEERVPTPEETVRRKRAAPESDDETPVDEEKQKKNNELSCKYCNFTTKYHKTLKEHLYRHYNLKPYKCPVCSFMGHRVTLSNHLEKFHPGLTVTMESTPMPDEPPKNLLLERRKVIKQPPPPSDVYMVCLRCEKSIPGPDVPGHVHDNEPREFAKKGDVVVKCCICLALRLDVKSLQEHHNSNHPDIPINYSFFKMHCESRDIHHCGHCKRHFKYLRDLKTHHNAVHNSLQLNYTTLSVLPGTGTREDDRGKRKSEDVHSVSILKRVAKKSTTKLPMFKTVARKSTTKLPVMVYSDDSDIEPLCESSYGKKPAPIENYSDVTALMPFCGTIMRFTMKKLTEIIPIDPTVTVKDIKSDLSGKKNFKKEY